MTEISINTISGGQNSFKGNQYNYGPPSSPSPQPLTTTTPVFSPVNQDSPAPRNPDSTSQGIPTGSGRLSSEILQNDADKDLMNITVGKESLYKIIQTEVRHEDHGEVPYCVLGFRLKTGNSEKEIIEVSVTGEFQDDTSVKGIWPLRSDPNRITKVPVVYNPTRHNQVELGINGNAPNFNVTIGNSESQSYTLTAGQTFETDMGKNEFTVSLGVSKTGPKFTVVDRVEFWVVVRPNGRRQSMSLQLLAHLKYRRSMLPSKGLQRTEKVEYSGRESDDIRKYLARNDPA